MQLHYKNAVFVAYSFLNGTLSRLTSSQFRFVTGCCMSVNTRATVRRFLKDAGFSGMNVEYFDRKIIFSAANGK